MAPLFTSIERNKLGEGTKKIVYSIDWIDDYVIAHLKQEKEDLDSDFVDVNWHRFWEKVTKEIEKTIYWI